MLFNHLFELEEYTQWEVEETGKGKFVVAQGGAAVHPPGYKDQNIRDDNRLVTATR